ncbi:MAG: hypothetical protein GTN40_00485 [Candidatus Aenigmarchaeota archaeon]|nr:hypothetical protein [Candidatus Aenigmarchaeota archaeon]
MSELENYHGILLDTEFKDPNFIKKFKILGKRKSREQPWVVYRVVVPAEKVNEMIKEGQEKLVSKQKYYFHLYNDEEVIIVFKNKIFKVKISKHRNHKNVPEDVVWKPVIEYGLSLDIPLDQLTFWPCSYKEDEYYKSEEDEISD